MTDTTANGKRIDSTQEIIALGVGTFLGSFIGSMPITSSFARSAVQSSSGAKTPFTNIYAGIPMGFFVKFARITYFYPFQTGVVVLFALAFIMPLMAYIPKTVLSAVIITSVIFMVEVEEIKPMWKTNSNDF